MTAPAAQWQLDRLSTNAREAAETASLGAGVSLSSWLTKLIGETCSAEGVTLPAAPPKILEFTRENRDRVAATSPLEALPAGSPPPPLLQPRQRMAIRPAAIPVPVPRTPNQQPVHAAAPLAPTPVEPAALAPPQRSVESAPIDATVHKAPTNPAADTSVLPIAAMVAANLGTRRGDDIPETLLADIRTHGIRQPVTVRRAASNPEQYEIICGHRRWRAAQRAGLTQIPAIVATQEDASAILTSLGENLRLNDLSVIDEAHAYLRLMTQCAVEVSAITAAIGCDRKHVVQSLRLLGLPPLVRHLISSGMLSRDHAFLLLEASQPEALADAILAEHLSVDAARQRIAAGAGSKP